MNKISTLVAATAMAFAAAAPVLAEDAKVSADPFVSTQGQGLGLGVGGTAAGIIAAAIVVGVVASGGNGGTSTTTTTN